MKRTPNVRRREQACALMLALAWLLTGALPSPAIAAPQYQLPLAPGTSATLSQGTDDPGRGDHVGKAKYAIDLENQDQSFPVAAARAGTVVELQGDSTTQCRDLDDKSDGTSLPGCWTQANLVLIDHGDGTSALYMHLAPGSLRVHLNDRVSPGAVIGSAGHTGFVIPGPGRQGNHLHFEVEATPSSAEEKDPSNGKWWTQSQDVPVAYQAHANDANVQEGLLSSLTVGTVYWSPKELVATPQPPTLDLTGPPQSEPSAKLKPAPIPGGTWISPASDLTPTQAAVRFAAHAAPSNPGDPPIDHVNFTVWWLALGPKIDSWKVACEAKPPGTGDVFGCDVDLSKLGAPPGPLAVSFDVYDQGGNKNPSPNGERSLMYSPPPPTSLSSIRKVDWNKVLRNDPDLTVADDTACPASLLAPIVVTYKSNPSVRGLPLKDDAIVYGDISGDGNEVALLPLVSECAGSGGEESLLVYKITATGPRIVAALYTAGLGMEIHVIGNRLQLRYVVLLPGDSYIMPSGGTRITQYQLQGNQLLKVTEQTLPPSSEVARLAHASFPLRPFLPYTSSDFDVTNYEIGPQLRVQVKSTDVSKVRAEVEAWIRGHGVDPKSQSIHYVQ